MPPPLVGGLEVLEHLDQDAQLDALGVRLDLLGLRRKLIGAAGEEDDAILLDGGDGRIDAVGRPATCSASAASCAACSVSASAWVASLAALPSGRSS